MQLKTNTLGLAKWIIFVCKRNKIHSTTFLQQICIPSILHKKDLIVNSRTGTGKTLTFVLPVLHLAKINKINFQTIIMVPSKELGLQINDNFNKLGKIMAISSYFLFKFNPGLKKINLYSCISKKIFIMTFNEAYRFLIYKKKYFKKKVSILVIDESDLLFKNIFNKTIRLIFSNFRIKQTLLFGCTVDKKAIFLKKLYYKSLLFCFQEKNLFYTNCSSMTQEYIFCPSSLKTHYTEILLNFKYNFFTNLLTRKVIIFVSSKKFCEKLFLILKKNFMKIGRIHDGVNFSMRVLTLQMLATKKINILICTDLVSRGLDCSSIDLVINYSFPKNTQAYVHRIGRCARFGKKGYCLNLISKKEAPRLYYLQKKMNLRIKKISIKPGWISSIIQSQTIKRNFTKLS